MRWTRRKYAHMGPVQVTFTVSADDWVRALALADSPEPAKLTLRRMRELVCMELTEHGLRRITWFTDGEPDQDQWDWARSQVVRHWPRLAAEVAEKDPRQG
jgi:hypothetical protein